MFEKLSQNSFGIICAFGAFFMWGIFPVYFKILKDVSVYELLAYRIIFSFLLLLILLYFSHTLIEIRKILKNSKLLLLLFLTSFLIALNWFIYIIAVLNNNITEASLGYFINPLVNIFFGILFFKERTNKYQKFAIFLMFVAILQEIYFIGKFPFVSISLALTFGFYGLIRKFLHVSSFSGLFIETTLLVPFAIFYILFFVGIGNTSLFVNLKTASLLLLSGPITVAPLILFASAATRIKLSTLGFIQYLSPIMTLFLAVFIYNEDISHQRMITFVLIWSALIIVSFNSFLHNKRKNHV